MTDIDVSKAANLHNNFKKNESGFCSMPGNPLVQPARPGDREEYYKMRGEEMRNGSAAKTEAT